MDRCGDGFTLRAAKEASLPSPVLLTSAHYWCGCGRATGPSAKRKCYWLYRRAALLASLTDTRPSTSTRWRVDIQFRISTSHAFRRRDGPSSLFLMITHFHRHRRYSATAAAPARAPYIWSQSSKTNNLCIIVRGRLSRFTWLSPRHSSWLIELSTRAGDSSEIDISWAARTRQISNELPITCNMFSQIDGNEPVNLPFFKNKKNKNRYETRTVFMNEFPRVKYLLKLETFWWNDAHCCYGAFVQSCTVPVQMQTSCISAGNFFWYVRPTIAPASGEYNSAVHHHSNYDRSWQMSW
jgi:hypothetical protein